MPRRRATTQAEVRLALTEADSPSDIAGLGDLADMFTKYLPGVIETLGEAAQPVTDKESGLTRPGDTEAAKKILDFLTKAMTSKDRKGQEVLARVAEIRRAALAKAANADT